MHYCWIRNSEVFIKKSTERIGKTGDLNEVQLQLRYRIFRRLQLENIDPLAIKNSELKRIKQLTS
jgi:hypothetical protein